MKLTRKEIELLTSLAECRKRRKRDAWVWFLATYALLVAVLGYGLLPSLAESPLLGLAAAFTLTHLVHVYFGVRPDDKLIDLLQRYVNQDPDAIQQLSDAAGSHSKAA